MDKFKLKVNKKHLTEKTRKALKRKVVTRSYVATTVGEAIRMIGGKPAKRQEKRGRIALDAKHRSKRG